LRVLFRNIKKKKVIRYPVRFIASQEKTHTRNVREKEEMEEMSEVKKVVLSYLQVSAEELVVRSAES